MNAMEERKIPNPPRRCMFCGHGPISKEHIFAQWMHPYLPNGKDFESGGTPIHTLQLTQVGFDGGTSAGSLLRGKLDRPGVMKSKSLRVVCVRCNNEWMGGLQTKVKPILLPFIGGEWIALTPAAQQLLAAWITMFAIVVEKTDESVETFTQAQRTEFYEQMEQHRRPLKNCLIWIFSHHDEDIPVGFFIRTTGVSQQDGVADTAEINVSPHPGASITLFSLNKIGGVVISTIERGLFVSVRSELKKLAASAGLSLLWPISPFGPPEKPIRTMAISHMGDFLDSAGTILVRGIATHLKPSKQA